MAYTRAMNAATQFGDPLIVPVCVTNTIAETNIPVKIPWNNVDLTYAYSVATVAVDATGDMVVVLNNGSSGGTVIGNLTIACTDAVGDIDEVTLAAPASRKNLLNSDSINIKVDGSAAAAGQVMLYLYFEPSEYA